jgi:hypothetical protein
MGHGAWGMGHGAWGMGHGAWGMGHGAWGMGHGAWGIVGGGGFINHWTIVFQEGAQWIQRIKPSGKNPLK